MRILSTVILIFSLVIFIRAQVVVSQPPFATENDSIIITFDATKGDAGLKGYTGKVYTHTGATVNGVRWQHVIGSWGDDASQPQLTRIGTDLYRLVIGNPHKFYGVSQSDKISELCFVFRGASGSNRSGRDVGGEDIFLSLYEPGVTALIIEPHSENPFGDPRRSPVFASAGDTLTIKATAAGIGTTIDHLELWTDQNLLTSTTNDTLIYKYFVSSGLSGYLNLMVKAYGSIGQADSVSCEVMVNPAKQYLARPAGVQDGINYSGGRSVTLSLLAPYKKFVYLIGDFNDWMVDEAYFMNIDSVAVDSVRYWITLDNLDPDREYAFQYLVDGELRLADPYTEKVLDPWNDKYISNTTYPNLKPYPAGKTDMPAAVFQINRDEYQWQVSNFDRPPQEELVIYELLVRDFVATHDYKTLIDSLDYFERLGINAIELMPVNEFEGNLSWGYNPSFHFAPDKYYGTANDLKHFIDACHQRGIAVILDMVLNHVFGQSPFVRLYVDYYASDEIIIKQPNPWFNRRSPNQVFKWGADFNHESPATQRLVDRINRYWLEEFRVDGFRFDFSKGFTNKSGDGWAFDGSRINLLKRMADKIWNTSPDAYVILEHFADNNEERILADYGMMLWGNQNYSYNEATMGYHDNGKSDFSWGYFGERGWSKPGLVTYMESHDEERLMYKNLQYGNSLGDYSIKELPTALNRMKMAAAFFLLQPGPKMIWQFGELGYDYSIDYNNDRIGNKPIRWDYYQDEQRRNLYKSFAALLKLRRENPTFSSPWSTVNMQVSGPAKRMNISHGLMKATVIGNFGVSPLSITPNFQHTGTWYDYFYGDTLQVNDVNATIVLGPGEFFVYTDRKLESPAEDFLTDIGGRNDVPPADFQLEQNYPNPFNPQTTIRYRIAAESEVELSVFNLLGQKVATLVSGNQAAGQYRVNWNGEGQASGVYLYTLTVVSQGRVLVKTGKMVLLK